jgi:hypothetical protein
MRRVGGVSWGVGLLAALSLACGSATAAAPDLSRMSPSALLALTRALPKGGELHLHLSGAVSAESYLDWAVKDGLCIDVQALAITDPPCADPHKPAADALADRDTYQAMLDSLSVRHPGFRGRSAHDQFFGTFARFGPALARRRGDALAEVMDRAAVQNTFYLELMAPGAPAGFAQLALAAPGDIGDMPALKSALAAAGLDMAAARVRVDTDDMEARARQVLGCATPAPRPGCQVTVRYLFAALRSAPPKVTFAQLQLGVAMTHADRRWVGVQIVAPEDDPSALANYALVARMIDFLTGHGRDAPVAAHAGELSAGLVPPEALRDHVAQAVRISGARRIGHGTDIAGEADAEALAREMAARGVLVEVNLTSNAVTLGVEGAQHPYGWLRAHGVPVSLSTDDPGVSRIDLAGEYALAVRYGADYAALKTSARNALAFSFLAGQGLWRDPGVYLTPAPACRGQIGQAAPRGACTALVAASDKAREQWRHEALLARFEAGFPTKRRPRLAGASGRAD